MSENAGFDDDLTVFQTLAELCPGRPHNFSEVVTSSRWRQIAGSEPVFTEQ